MVLDLTKLRKLIGENCHHPLNVTVNIQLDEHHEQIRQIIEDKDLDEERPFLLTKYLLINLLV